MNLSQGKNLDPTEENSILGYLGPRYHYSRCYTPRDNFNYIFDNPVDGSLHFYVAGFTKPCTFGDFTDRQAVHTLLSKLYDHALGSEIHHVTNPWDKYNIQVELRPDPCNNFDLHALQVAATIPNGFECGLEPRMYLLDMGFVPAKISEVLSSHLNWITSVNLLTTTSKLYGSVCNTSLHINYKKRINNLNKSSQIRFQGMLAQ